MTPREKLTTLAGRLPARCLWLGLPSATTAEIAGLAGAEIAMIDTEHGAIGVETMVGMLRALEASDTGVLVRVPQISEGAIKHALDGGAGGVLVPYVETLAEAERAVRAALYPPQGVRGQAAGVIRATGYGRDSNYVESWNYRAFTAVQIESRKALENVSAIAAVPGLDMLFFGPFDFAQDAGIDPEKDGERLWEVFRAIATAARETGRTVGVFPWPGADAKALAEAGADLIAVGSDISTLRQGLRDAVQAISLSTSDVS
jgi:2-keto-3-deoxy-L-rhamnonate aldolase RhmA